MFVPAIQELSASILLFSSSSITLAVAVFNLYETGYTEPVAALAIINVVIIELGMIVPPIGINVFVIHGMARNISLSAIYRGVTPFIIADIVRLAILVAFPVLTLWLPAALK